MGAEHELFRSQVIAHAGGRLYGDVLVRPRVAHLSMTLLMATLCASIVYLASTVEWSRVESVAGIFEPGAQGQSSMRATLYVPVSIRKKLEVGRTYYVSVDGLRNQAWTTITIERISDSVLDKCPICSVAEARKEPYVRIEAIALDPMIRLDDEWLALTAGIRFHFDLKPEKQTVWKLLSGRFRPAQG
jgi:hypothetical protein